MSAAAGIERSMGEWATRGAIAVGSVVAALALTQPAQAQRIGNAPWCADMTEITGYVECQYFTYQQCHARVWGVTNICFTNPWYVPARPPAPSRRPPRKPPA
jgi:hypothetical protein